MKKNILFALVLLLFLSCNQKKLEYQFNDKEDLTFTCEYQNKALIKEALYTFEEYIEKNYAAIDHRTIEGYRSYLHLLYDNSPPASEYFSDHLKDVVNTLLKEEDLWVQEGYNFTLNYNNPFVKCLIENIEDKDIKNTLNILKQTNTLKAEVVAPIFYEKKNLMVKDKALATYVALDMFYAKVFHMNTPGYVRKKKITDAKYKMSADEVSKLKPVPLKKDSLK